MSKKYFVRRKVFALLTLWFLPFLALAQQVITGKVTSKDQIPLDGISITIKGTTNGTFTGAQGEFSIEAKKGDILIISGVGYKTAEIPVSTSPISVQLSDDSEDLGEVVVTALGMKREAKRLGYAVQEVKGSELDKARETNFVSGLAGKVAGLQVMTSPSGVGGSARVTIRGDKSTLICSGWCTDHQ